MIIHYLNHFIHGLFIIILGGFIMNVIVIITWCSLRIRGNGSFNDRRMLRNLVLCRIFSCFTCLSFSSFDAFCSLKMGSCCRRLCRIPVLTLCAIANSTSCFLGYFSTLSTTPSQKYSSSSNCIT